MKNPQKATAHAQYHLPPQVFDAFNKEVGVQEALGSRRSKSKQESADIRSSNWSPGVSGWRLTPSGLELGAVGSGLFPPGSILFADIQNIATDKILGRDTAGSGVIEQLGLGAGLSITGGNLVNTVSAYTTEEAQDAVGNAVGNGLDYDDGTGAISVDETELAAASIGGFTEAAQDATGAMVDATLTYVDGTPLLGVAATYKRKSLFDSYADVSVGGAETDIYTHTTAAGQLAADGEKINSVYGGNFVTVGTELTQLKVYFGGTAIWDSTGIAPSSGTSSWRVAVELVRISATAVRYAVSLNTSGASGFVYCTVGELGSLTLANTNILKITGTSSGVGSGVGDIVGKLGTVQWLAAA